jgi:L-fuconate dehydratase
MLASHDGDMTRIVALETRDIRARTSAFLDGSDAAHADPDYSAAYTIVTTDHPDGLEGHGFTFTIGRGNELCCAAIEALAHHVVGRDLAEITGDMAGWWRSLTSDSQLRWLGPEKGVIHLATAAIVNAVWDLWAKTERTPVWELVAGFTPEQYVGCIDFRYLSDALDRDRALDILRAARFGREERITAIAADGLPAYITSAGWLGYPDEKVRELCRQLYAQGWRSFKTKVGISVEADRHRCQIMRDELGPDVQLMVDANQVWDVPQAIEWIRQLGGFDLRWIEEPTSPDDVLGHATIRAALAPLGIKVATGEHVANRVVFKQLLQAEAIDYLQADACRVGGLNEVLAILLLARRFDVPVCAHAGGIGLCEYVQHIAAIDHVVVGAPLTDRTTEYASHLHDHFIDPARVRNGRYLVPTRPGYSAQLHADSYARLAYPGGTEWR